LLAGVVSAAPSSQAGPTLRIQAGAGEQTVSINQYLVPGAGSSVIIPVGGTVQWTIGSDEQHTITFLGDRPRPEPFLPPDATSQGRPIVNGLVFDPPQSNAPWDGTTYVNSSPIGRGQDFSVTFAAAGNYPYVCLFHPEMTGLVTVVPAGAPVITSQADVDNYRTSHIAQHQPGIAQLQAVRSIPVQEAGPNSTTLHFVRAGTRDRSQGGHVEFLAFLPDNVTVSQGDMVIWYNDDPVAPHTVTFIPPGQDPPDFIAVQLPDGSIVSPSQLGPPPGGPPPAGVPVPRAVGGNGVFPTLPTTTYSDPSLLYNSGIFSDDVPPAGSAFALTFDAPGTWQYICLIHAEDGMVGTVTVLPR
jgi:plastocyanin